MSKTIRIELFAELAETAGQSAFTHTTDALDVAALYAELRGQFKFRFPQTSLKAARNGAFTTWDQALLDQDQIAFLPPYSGG